MPSRRAPLASLVIGSLLMLSMPASAQPASSPRGETVDLQITVAPCVAHLEQRLREIIAIELRTTHSFYDYHAKYIANDTQYLCPAPLSVQDTAILNALCLQAFNSLGCEGWGRVDVMRDEQGQFWLLEVNTVPGMTDHSLVPMAARASGLSFGELLLKVLASKGDR